MRCEAVTALGEPLQSLEQANPKPGPGEAVVRVSRCGVCHSDVHLHDGYFDMGGGNKLPSGSPLPLVLGHEIEGEVVALGEGVLGPQVGTRVAVFPWIGCGQCTACKRGEQHYCGNNRQLGVRVWGGFADHVLVPDAAALIPSGNLAPGVAGVAMCSGLTAFSALKKIKAPDPAEPIVLFGVGGVGLSGLALAKALFKNPIVAVDLDPAKRAQAIARGASEAIDPTEKDALKNFVKRTGGAVGAVDFVGAPATFQGAQQVVRRGGTVVVVGLFGGSVNFSIPMLPLKTQALVGSYCGSLDEAKELIALLQTGKVDPPVLEERPLSAANQTLTDLKEGKIMGRVVLTV
ncbi:MAG: alcohol dehydrogenase catalytic domain-containing protein [Caulobacterales bacterium]